MAIQFKSSQALASLQITPLIDIVFLLLIFFLVATRFADEDRDLDVNLPAASEAQPLMAEVEELFLHVDPEGTYFLGRNKVSAEGLESALRAAMQQHPERRTVILRADRRADWQAVAAAINTCHRAGLHDIRPRTQLEDGP